MHLLSNQQSKNTQAGAQLLTWQFGARKIDLVLIELVVALRGAAQNGTNFKTLIVKKLIINVTPPKSYIYKNDKTLKLNNSVHSKLMAKKSTALDSP